MKLCFSTLGCYDYSLDDIIKLAKDYSVDALEIRGIGGVMDNFAIPEFAEENAAATVKRLSAEGISILSLGTSCSFHDRDKRAAMIESAKGQILIAKRLGAPFIRVFGNNLTEDKEACFERVGTALAEISDFAAEQGVTVLLEIHGDYNSIENVTPVLNIVGNRKGFGIIWDIAHSDRVYGENWESFYELIRPYIKHIHLKDHKDGVLTLPGEGTIPIRPIVDRLVADGYTGYFSLEWEKKWHPEIGNIEPAMDRISKILFDRETV